MCEKIPVCIPSDNCQYNILVGCTRLTLYTRERHYPLVFAFKRSGKLCTFMFVIMIMRLWVFHFIELNRILNMTYSTLHLHTSLDTEGLEGMRREGYLGVGMDWGTPGCLVNYFTGHHSLQAFQRSLRTNT